MATEVEVGPVVGKGVIGDLKLVAVGGGSLHCIAVGGVPIFGKHVVVQLCPSIVELGMGTGYNERGW